MNRAFGAAHSTSAPTAVGGLDGTSSHAYDAGLLVLRLVLGLTTAAHGAQKLFGWFGGAGLEATGRYFDSSGYPGQAMALLVGLGETFGGLGLALGLATPMAGAAVVVATINAMAVKWGGGFFSPRGLEYELLQAATAAGLAFTGPGRLAVDRFLMSVRAHQLRDGVAAVSIALLASGLILLIRT